MHKQMMRILVVIIFLLSLLGGSGCVSEDYTVLDGNESVTEKHTSFVTWLDADGSIIATEQVPEDYDPSTRALPKDSSSWHYTGWQLTHSGDIIVCSATRVAMKHYIWKDYDGTLLKDVYVPENEEIPSLDLPQSNEKWNYIEWTQEGSNSDILFKAKREPNKDFFVGNIFQIILKDQSGNILGSGSGFVINQDGWFITNDHVMEKGHSAIAFFDIKDSTEGQQYTQLNILGGVYHNTEKDIFIGKLDGYEKISQYYKNIAFTENYTQGETSYSVGYPNSSTKLQINAGTILEEYSDIHSKVNGVYYILSDSYIAPGSSGGILVNENFDVIGITSIGFYADSNKQQYTSGGSIPYFVFKNALTQLSDNRILPLYDIYKN